MAGLGSIGLYCENRNRVQKSAFTFYDYVAPEIVSLTFCRRLNRVSQSFMTMIQLSRLRVLSGNLDVRLAVKVSQKLISGFWLKQSGMVTEK